MKWSIVLSSDLHFGSLKSESGIDIRADKKEQVKNILEMKDEHNVEIVISVGDLTEYGTDGNSWCSCRKMVDDELTPLKEKWVKPLEDNNIKVLLGIGNHDSYTGHPYCSKPVFKYIKNKHNATYYPWVGKNYSGCYTYTKNNILFICMGIYPKNLRFLRNHLPKNKDNPIIIFYHYNTISDEPHSDWWKTNEKEDFYQVIKDRNIVAIINGHIHATYHKTWSNFPMLNGGGGKLLRMNMEDDKMVSTDMI